MFNSARTFRLSTATSTTFSVELRNRNGETIAVGMVTADADSVGFGGLTGLVELYPEMMLAISRQILRLVDLRIRLWSGDIGAFVASVGQV